MSAIIAKLVAFLFLIVCSIGIGIITMVYGWGVMPKSWPVIIGVGIFGQMFIHVILELIKYGDKK